ncbi:MAG: T9SS type A sorting domain-containing protein, partial [Elusimicrobia bacterium]|nr:T9SS type A sorting domain-containing protein [Elusimicrobiota bacterium]
GDLTLPAAEGGRIQTPSQAAVDVPPGALDQDTEITLARGRDLFKSDRAAALDRDRLGAGGEAISFGPEGTQFSRPVTIELPYDPALVPPGSIANLAVHYYDPSAKTWTALASRVDPARHVVSAQTTHFSLYQPLGRGIGPMAADASFGFKAAYVFPNPVRGVSSVTIRVQPGQADSVEVRVYDLSGRKIYSSSNFTNQGALDDGNGLGAQFTYDHVWDISGVGSGVYQYVITAKKSGQADIHKTGKLGVIK